MNNKVEGKYKPPPPLYAQTMQTRQSIWDGVLVTKGFNAPRVDRIFRQEGLKPPKNPPKSLDGLKAALMYVKDLEEKENPSDAEQVAAKVQKAVNAP